MLIKKLRSYLCNCCEMVNSTVANLFCIPIVEVFYGGFWKYRERLISLGKERTRVYDAYLNHNCASIGLKSIFKAIPTTPHGLHGIHISDGAVLGKDITIMQNVTIGSNTLKDTKRYGAPKIGDNVFIGANSSIIGGISLGNNCRIGANCCCYMDVLDNQTVVLGGVKCVPHKRHKDNLFSYFTTT